VTGQHSRHRRRVFRRFWFASTAALAMAVPLGVGVAVLPSGTANATTDTVTNCNDSGSGSLRQAVSDASSGDTITFALSPACSVITLTTGDIEISSDLTIDGPGESVLAVSGSNTSRVFQVDETATASFSGLTIEDGSATGEGGGILNDGDLTLEDSTLSNNTVATGSGGGASGGGLANEGNATVTATSFIGNVATSTGYGALGGAIYNDDGSLTVTNAILSGNAANNTASGDALGGAITNANGNVKVADTALMNNSADSSYGTYGGGINNGSYGIDSGTITVVDSTLSGNTATGTYFGPVTGGGGNGGGLDNYGTVAISESTVADNTATTNSTYSFGGVGGGINNFGTMSVTHTTLANNSANSGDVYAASINSSGNDLTVLASIVAQGSGRECFGPVTDGGYNSDDDGSCGFTGTGSVSDSPTLDATLGTLANNGGTTNTIALLGGSPAFDTVALAADCSGNDQRGVPWPTPCDMGAIQSGESILQKTATDLTSVPNPSTFGQSITFTAKVSPSDGDGTVDFTTKSTPVSGCASQTLALVAGSYEATCTVSSLTAGPHPITATYSGDANYGGSSGALMQNISPAPLTVTANNVSRYFGAVNPAFTATVTGFVLSQTSNVVSGSPSCTSAATSTSNVGRYPITCTQGSLTAANYVFSTFVAGTLTIAKAPTTISALPISIIGSILGHGPTFTATLTSTVTKAGVAGQTIAFTLGSFKVCSATSNANGVATCKGPILSIFLLLGNRSYSATFNGSGNYLSSSGKGTVMLLW
jgi:hypothetical protein